MSAIPHFGFIVAAFIVAGVVIAAMIGMILWDYRDLRTRLARLESREPGAPT